jgi:AraC-like DNA-binding protein
MTNLPSTADFIIPAENVQTVVTLLLSNKISFTLISSNDRDLKAIERTEEKSTDTVVLSKSNARYVTFETIYRKYLEENIEQKPPTESEIATEFGMTLVAFKNGFKSVYGIPFYQLYMERKMEYAAVLLRQGLRAAKVSERIGYSHAIKFNKMFQKYFGITPKQYQSSQIDKGRARV